MEEKMLEEKMSTEKWEVRWKRNKNDKGVITTYSFTMAIKLAEEKKVFGYYKIEIKKIPPLSTKT